MDERKRHARAILDIALKYDDLDRFLTGTFEYELKTHDLMGNEINDYYLVMQTIYEKYKEDKSLELDKKVYETMMNILKTQFYEPWIINLIHDIEYQMLSEKQKTAPFELDCIELLNELKNNIERNKERYQNNKVGMWEKLQNHDETINNHYGHRIL